MFINTNDVAILQMVDMLDGIDGAESVVESVRIQYYVHTENDTKSPDVREM